MPPPPYSPMQEAMPAWLADGLPTTTEDRMLAATILAWQVRGARVAQIVEALTTWGVRRFGGGGWSAATVRACHWPYTHGSKQAQRALLLAHGFTTEARQHGAWWRRQRPR